MKRGILAVIAIFFMNFTGVLSAENTVTEEQVDKAIQKATKFVTSSTEFNAAGKKGRANGSVALGVVAVLTAGVAPSEIQNELSALAKAAPSGIYTAALTIMALEMANPEDDLYKSAIKKNQEFIEGTQLQHGVWGYGRAKAGKAKPAKKNNQPNKNNGNAADKKQGDNSNTQFAMLGLWYARLAGYNPSQSTLSQNMAHFVSTQGKDGGWAYKGKATRSYGSMTCAGISSLLIATKKLKAKGKVDEIRGIRQTHIRRGIEWLEKNFSVTTNPGRKSSHYYYYLYSMERVGILSGLKYFGAHNWYAEGAEHLVSSQNEDGSWGSSDKKKSRSSEYLNTCFALLFLGKGKTPTMIKRLSTDEDFEDDEAKGLSKLALGKLGKKLGKKFNFESVDTYAKAEDLLEAPLLVLNGKKFPKFKKETIKKIKDYIDNGGTLLVSAKGGSKKFDEGFQSFLSEVLETPRLKKVGKKHPLYSKSGKDKKISLSYAGDAYHASIIYAPEGLFDGSIEARKDVELVLGKIAEFVIKGKKRTSRLEESSILVEDDEVKDGHLSIASVLLGSNSDIASQGSMARLGDHLKKNGYKSAVKRSYVSFKLPISVKRFPIIHLSASGKVKLSVKEKVNLKKYLKSGGTLFVDPYCGCAEFSASIKEILTEMYGDAFKENASLLRKITLGQTKVRAQFKKLNAKVYTVMIKKRPAVIFMDTGVSDALNTNFSYYNRKGLENKEAKGFLSNLVKVTHKLEKASVISTVTEEADEEAEEKAPTKKKRNKKWRKRNK